jgi:hypothetical protein
MILPAVVRAERLVAKRRAYARLQNVDRENEAYPELEGNERKRSGGFMQQRAMGCHQEWAREHQLAIVDASRHGTKHTVEKSSCIHPLGMSTPCSWS